MSGSDDSGCALPDARFRCARPHHNGATVDGRM